MGSLRLSAKSLRRPLVQKSATAARAADVPGLHQVTSRTLRSTWSPALTATQSIGFFFVTVTIEGAGGVVGLSKGGMGTSHLGKRSVIFLRIVRAPTSHLSLATHTGTTLCASTSKTGIDGSASHTPCFHAFGTRIGEKSVTTAHASCSCTKAGSVDTGCPCSSTKGTPRVCSSASTSCNPESMKPYCRIVASRNDGTRQKHTDKGMACFSASSRA